LIYALDTNVIVKILRGSGGRAIEKIKTLEPADIKIPSVVRAELLVGALKSARPKHHQEAVQRFLEPYEELPFSGESCPIYAKVRTTLEKKGQAIGGNDLLIAATALANEATLITGKVKEFKRVRGLKVVDWLG